MSDSEKLRTQFYTDHPDVGRLERGAFIGGEQAYQFSEAIRGKIIQLSRKQELTHAEQTFIDNTMDMAARSLVYLTTQGVRLPASETAQMVARDMAVVLGRAAHGTAEKLTPELSQELAHVAGDPSLGIRHRPVMRAPVEDLAANSMRLLGETISASDGVPLDAYLAGNIQNIIGVYELAEAPRPN